MNRAPKQSALQFNADAKLVTMFFVFYLALEMFTVIYFSPYFAVTTPFPPIVGSMGIFAEAAVGFKATRMFGGRRNFTGRLLTYYSIALVGEAISWDVWGLFARGQIPSGVTLLVLSLGAFVGQFISSFTLLISARALLLKLDRRALTLVLIALFFSTILSLSFLNLFYSSPALLFVWSGLWSGSVFIQLASGLILVSLLGRWYMAKPISYIAFAYVAYSIGQSILTIVALTSYVPPADFWVIVAFITATSFYVVGLAMTQARPLKHDVAAPKSTV